MADIPFSSVMGGSSAIKSIQRGNASNNFNTNPTITVSIATVDPAKCSVNITSAFGVAGINGSGTAAYRKFYVRIDSISATEIVFSGSSQNESLSWSWEVIEYV